MVLIHAVVDLCPGDPSRREFCKLLSASYENFVTLLRQQGPEKLDDAIVGLKCAINTIPIILMSVGLELALGYESKDNLADAVTLPRRKRCKRSRPCSRPYRAGSDLFPARKEDGCGTRESIYHVIRETLDVLDRGQA